MVYRHDVKYYYLDTHLQGLVGTSVLDTFGNLKLGCKDPAWFRSSTTWSASNVDLDFKLRSIVQSRNQSLVHDLGVDLVHRAGFVIEVLLGLLALSLQHQSFLRYIVPPGSPWTDRRFKLEPAEEFPNSLCTDHLRHPSPRAISLIHNEAKQATRITLLDTTTGYEPCSIFHLIHIQVLPKLRGQKGCFLVPFFR